jgi:hypothetical protein
MASRILWFPKEEETYIQAPTWFSDDLPAHIQGAAHWVPYENHLGKSQYHIEIAPGVDIPVEFINHHWYFLHWEPEGYYSMKQTWKLPIREYRTGYYYLTDPEHPEHQHPSPLEA